MFKRPNIYYAVFNNGIAIGFNPDKVAKGKESLISHPNNNTNSKDLFECKLSKFKKATTKDRVIEMYEIMAANYIVVDKDLSFKKDVECI